MTDPKTPSFIHMQKEIIWHMTCGACSYYWTVPTMDEKDNPARRRWTCPLCGTKSPVQEKDS